MMDAAAVREYGIAKSKVASVFTAPELRDLGAFVEACKGHLKAKAAQLILEAQGQPVMLVYTSDGTPNR